MDGANGDGNRKGIGVEICYSKSGGDRFIAAEKLAAEFIAQELKKKGWGLDKVKKHQDFGTNKKYCPHRTLDMGWQRFLDMINSYMNPANPEPATPNFKVGDIVNFAGGKHYTSANGSTGYNVTAGPAKITVISSGAKHPYHLVHTDKTSNVYGWVDASTVSAKKVEIAPTPTPAPQPIAPQPQPTKPLEIVKGAIVQFKGGKHYTGANSSTGYAATAGQAKVTNISKDAKHPYHLIHTDAKSNVYGWVDTADIEGAVATVVTPAPTSTPVITEIKNGDTVYFKGGKNYFSSNGGVGYNRTAGYATVTNIAKGKKYPYHVVRISGKGSNVYGWVAADLIQK